MHRAGFLRVALGVLRRNNVRPTPYGRSLTRSVLCASFARGVLFLKKSEQRNQQVYYTLPWRETHFWRSASDVDALASNQLREHAIRCNKLFVSTALHNLALIKDHNAIAMANRRKPMRNHNARAIQRVDSF